MQKFQAFMPFEFLDSLMPFNAELLKGNAMLVRACGAKPSDGSILRSREFLLFGHGMATLLPQLSSLGRDDVEGYTVDVTRKDDGRGVAFWEIQATEQATPTKWRLELASSPPTPSDGGQIQQLIHSNGQPGQYFFLTCPGE